MHRDTAFVGSPMALQALFQQCENPLVNRQIKVHYDYKSWLEPYCNKALKYISLPHAFLFTMECQMSVMQHKPFSTSPNWLPLRPQGINTVVDKAKLIESSQSSSLVVEELGLLGGFDALFKVIVGNEVTKESLIRNDSQRENSAMFGNLLPHFLEIDARAAVETVIQHQYESEVGYLNTLNDETKELNTVTNHERFGEAVNNTSGSSGQRIADNDNVLSYERFTPKAEQLRLYQAVLTKAGTATAGYILMLDYTKVTDEWLRSSPQVLNYFEQVPYEHFIK